MTNRFDHLVIAARDLAAASKAYGEGLGFDVRPGGRHTGRGTENAIIRFGLDYLELIAIYDEGEATRAGRDSLAQFLRRQDGGLAAFALATTDIDADADRLRAAGLEARGPFTMQRQRPDGTSLSWRLLVPGGDQYRKPWPFLIQWDQPDEERLAREAPGTHPNGARTVAEIAVVVADLEPAVKLYERQLGLPLVDRDPEPELAAVGARFAVGSFRVRLLAPTGPGPVEAALAALGEGPFQAVVAVEQLEASRRELTRRGTTVGAAPGIPGGLLIDPGPALGARLVLAPFTGP